MKTVTVRTSAGEDEVYCEWFACPACTEKDVARGFVFCPHCGARLDWTEIVKGDRKNARKRRKAAQRAAQTRETW